MDENGSESQLLVNFAKRSFMLPKELPHAEYGLLYAEGGGRDRSEHRAGIPFSEFFAERAAFEENDALLGS